MEKHGLVDSITRGVVLMAKGRRGVQIDGEEREGRKVEEKENKGEDLTRRHGGAEDNFENLIVLHETLNRLINKVGMYKRRQG
jgi:hypothetical protein